MRTFAVAGVSRSGRAAANAIFRKLCGAGYEVVPVNPAATEVEGVSLGPLEDSPVSRANSLVDNGLGGVAIWVIPFRRTKQVAVQSSCSREGE